MNVKFSFHYKLASSRRSVSWGAAQKTATEKLGKLRGQRKLPPIFLLAVFRAAHQTNKTPARGLV